MPPTPPRWVRLGAASPAARLTLLLLAALGHLLFLGSLAWTVPWSVAMPILLAGDRWIPQGEVEGKTHSPRASR